MDVRRIRQTKIDQDSKFKKLQQKLLKIRYGALEAPGKQTTCCICCEDFANEVWVRETACKHIFHNHCLMDWLKVKITAPECPFCRAIISV